MSIKSFEKVPGDARLSLYTAVGSVHNTVEAGSFNVAGGPFTNPKFKSNDIATFFGAKYAVPVKNIRMNVGAEYNIRPSKNITTLCTSGTIWGNKICNQRNFYIEPTYDAFAVKLGYAQQKIETTDVAGLPLFSGDTNGPIVGASWTKNYNGWDVGLNLEYATYSNGSLAKSTGYPDRLQTEVQ